MKYFASFVAVLLLIIVLVFSIQNRESVDVSFLLWSMSLPKIFLILGTYLFGMLSGWGFVEIAKRAFDAQ